MNAEERREVRRKRILENSENRLRKITTLSTNEIVSNGHVEFLIDKPENSTFNLESYEVTVPKCNAKNITPPVIHENHRVSNHELKLNHLNQNNLHFPSITNYKIKLLSITLLYVLLSQIVLMLLYYDLGFLFGNSIVVPFILSAIPEIVISKEQYNGIYMVVLIMLGLSQNLAKQISRCLKVVSVIGKRFCIYVFCFTCSYVILKHLHFNIEQNNSIT